MRNCIVTVENPDAGLYQEWAGARNGVVGHYSTNHTDPNELPHQDMMRQIKTWWCSERDVKVVVEYMSTFWVGQEIKIFNLTAVSTRLAGDLKHKEVTKDGVLPV